MLPETWIFLGRTLNAKIVEHSCYMLSTIRSMRSNRSRTSFKVHVILSHNICLVQSLFCMTLFNVLWFPKSSEIIFCLLISIPNILHSLFHSFHPPETPRITGIASVSQTWIATVEIYCKISIFLLFTDHCRQPFDVVVCILLPRLTAV